MKHLSHFTSDNDDDDNSNNSVNNKSYNTLTRTDLTKVSRMIFQRTERLFFQGFWPKKPSYYNHCSIRIS